MACTLNDNGKGKKSVNIAECRICLFICYEYVRV